LKYAIVLEDDVAIREGFSLFINKLLPQLPAYFDLVHLYVHAHRSEWLKRAANTEKTYVSYIPVCGRSAYLLSRSGAEKLLVDFQSIKKNADVGYGADPCGDIQICEMAQRGQLLVNSAKESRVDNLGQLLRQYNGERFRSNIYPRPCDNGDGAIRPNLFIQSENSTWNACRAIARLGKPQNMR